MSDKIPPRINGQKLHPKTELMNRSTTGEYLPRLGFVEDFLCSIKIVNVQINVYNLDSTPILAELKALPREMRKQALVPLYNSVINHYSHYKQLGRLDSVNSIFELSTRHAPEFELALQEELASIDPAAYAWKFEEEALTPLTNLAHVHLGLLTLFFEATAILYPEKAATEQVIQTHIEKALGMLREKLRDTLTPGNRVKGSLLLQAFCKPDSDQFDRYFRYEGRDYSIRGVQRFIDCAKETKSYEDHVAFSKPFGNEKHQLLADTLIELMDKFQALLKAKIEYRPEAEGSAGLPATP